MELSVSFGTKEDKVVQHPGMGVISPQLGMTDLDAPPEIQLSKEDRENINDFTQAQLVLDDPSSFEDYAIDQILFEGEGLNEEDDKR